MMFWARVLLLVGSLLLSGCGYLGFTQGLQRSLWGVSPVIEGFQADRGLGGSYRIGEAIVFRFRLSQPGYVTLVAVDVDKNTYELERNVRLEAGEHVLPLPTDVRDGAKATYLADLPTGPQRVRLLFSPVQAPPSLRFRGYLNGNALDRKTRDFLALARPSDVAETLIYVVR